MVGLRIVTVLTLGTLLLFPPPMVAQEGAAASLLVSGVAIDETTGAGVQGVAVFVEGSEIGTLTDDEGRYELRGVPNQNVTLRAHRLGYVNERRELWVCTPVLHPGSQCSSPPAADQRLNFFLRTAPPPNVGVWLIAPPSNR